MANNDLAVLKNKEVLVTGGCGFIGSEIVKQLSLIGANVTIIDNLSSGKEEYVEGLPNVKLITGDLLDDRVIESVVKDKEYRYQRLWLHNIRTGKTNLIFKGRA